MEEIKSSGKVNNYLKGSLKVLIDYGITLLIFGIFLYVFISVAKDKAGSWLPFYSVLFFLLLLLITYSDFKRLAQKELRPQYNLNPWPLKGFVYGLIGALPVFLVVVVFQFINYGTPVADRIEELILNTVYGPLFWILKIFQQEGYVEPFYSYFIAILAIPLISMAGYFAGNRGIEIMKYIKKTAPVGSTTANARAGGIGNRKKTKSKFKMDFRPTNKP